MKSLINSTYKLTAMSGILAVAFFAFVGNVNAQTPPCSTGVGSPLLVDVRQNITNDVDSGDHGNWALDNYERHIQVWLDNGTTYCAKVDYNGTFNAPAGVLSPQAGQSINENIGGTMVGGYTKIVTGVINASPTIPTTLDYGGTLGNISTWTQSLLPKVYKENSSASFLDEVFAPGYVASFTDGGNGWSWTYTSNNGGANGVWVNSGTGNSGDIGMIVNKTTGSVYSTIQTAIATATAGDTIVLGSDVTVSSELDINKAITLDGAGHKLSASFLRTDNSNNSAIGIKSVDGVTIKNLIVDGTGGSSVWLSQLHGINIYLSTNVNLNDVTVMNFGGAGINVNGSLVTVNNITTSGNSWGGINVDRPTVTNTTTLTVNGISSHNEVNAAIWRDDNTKTNVTVVDTKHQYSQSTYTHHTNIVGTLWKLLAVGQTTPDETGTATVTETNKEVVITATTTPITIDLGDVEDATIDFGSLITGGTGDIPKTTVNSDIATVEIPATTITSTDTSWDGTINLPKIITTTVEPTPEPGKTATVGSSIEVGFGETHLTFDDPVKLTFAGQANSSIGWSQNGVFHEITSTCDSATTPTLAADSECKIVVGSDLVVWTRHFTTFTTYTQASISVARSGGRSGNRVSPTLPSQASPVAVGRVLGAETVSPEIAAQIQTIKSQIAGLIAQLIGLLREQLATAIAAGLR